MNDIHRQGNFFNNSQYQYSIQLILHPPFHTQLEIGNILRQIRFKKNQLIADFGSGTGRLTIPLLQHNFNVLSIDVSKESLETLTSLAKALHLPLKTATSLPEDSSMAAVVGTDILHHVPLDEYIPKIYKALRKEGKIVFSEPGAFNIAWYLYLPFASQWDVEKGLIQCRYFNILNKLRKSGFRHISIKGLGLFPRSLLNFSQSLCRLNDTLGNMPILKFFAYRYIITAEK